MAGAARGEGPARGVRVASEGGAYGPWSVRVSWPAATGGRGRGPGGGGGGGTEEAAGAVLWLDAGAPPLPAGGAGGGAAFSGAPPRIPGVDALLLTSARPERVCALPLLLAALSAEVPVFASAPTKSLLRETLPRSRGLLGPPGAAWGDEEVRRALQRVRPLAPHAEAALAGGRLRLRAFPAGGPTLGAALFWAEGGGASVALAGDWGALAAGGLPRARLPRLRPDVLVAEVPAGDAGLGGPGALVAGGEPSARCRGRVLAAVQRCVGGGGKALLMCPPAAQRLLLEALRASLPPAVPVFVLPAAGLGRGPPGAGPQPLRARLFSRPWAGRERGEAAGPGPGGAGGGGGGGGGAAGGSDEGTASSGVPHWVGLPGVAEWDPRLADRPAPCVLFAEEAGLLVPPGPGGAGLGPAQATYQSWAPSSRNLAVGFPAALALLRSGASSVSQNGGRGAGIRALPLDDDSGGGGCDEGEGGGGAPAAQSSSLLALSSWKRASGAALRLVRQCAPRRVALVGAETALRTPLVDDLRRGVEAGLGLPCSLVPRRGGPAVVPLPAAQASAEVPAGLLRGAFESQAQAAGPAGAGAWPTAAVRATELELVFVREKAPPARVVEEAAVLADVFGTLPHEVLFECDVPLPPGRGGEGDGEDAPPAGKRPRLGSASSGPVTGRAAPAAARRLAAFVEAGSQGAAVGGRGSAAPTFSVQAVEASADEGADAPPRPARLRCSWARQDHELVEGRLSRFGEGPTAGDEA